MYFLIKPLLFQKSDPGKCTCHFVTKANLKRFNRFPSGAALSRGLWDFKNPALEKRSFGLHFKNPVGLAAGFDKNGELMGEMANLGFGFVEVGTVTPLPQTGNPKPRMFRLPDDGGLINRMGFNNAGADVVAERIAAFHEMQKKGEKRLIIGGEYWQK